MNNSDQNQEFNKAIEESLRPYIEAENQLKETVANVYEILAPYIKEVVKIDKQQKQNILNALEYKQGIYYPAGSFFGSINIPKNKPLSSDEFKKFSETLIEKLKKVAKKKKPNTDIVTLYLNKDSDLYSDLKKKRLIAFKPDSQRSKIFHHLLINRDYVATIQIQKSTNASSEASVRKAIDRINDLAKTRIKLKNDLIIARRGQGYRINPVYKIKKS